MRMQKALAVLALLALLAMAPAVTFSAPLATPVVDGRFYGADKADYDVVATALDDRGTLYQHYDSTGQVLYLAVEVAPKVNDNVFGYSKKGEPDHAYVASAGWPQGSGHSATKLIGSDHIGLAFWCGDSPAYTWNHGYLYDFDGDEDPAEADWLSGPLDGSTGGGTPPPGLLDTASTMMWNMNNSTWDVTLGGARAGSDQWKSPDGPEDRSNMDDTVATVDDRYSAGDSWYWYDSDVNRGWEWAIVYEMSIDVSDCGGEFAVDVISAHNSPAKDYEDVPIPVADFGDAPDPAYPTLLASTGAYHVLPLAGTGPTLGPTVDADPDGQPDAHAQGDDYDADGDDEDGVGFFSSPVLWGWTADVEVEIAGEGCYLNAWIDFGGDGSWAESGDQIFSDLWLEPGSHLPTFSVPSGSGWLVTYARFRCSTVDSATGGYTHIGRAPDGEVEDYELVVSDFSAEFGDLPDLYGTTLGQDGPYHTVVEDFFLGFLVDGEGNGNPSAVAIGDDLSPSGADDEDGVLLPSVLIPGETVYVQVYLTDTAGRGGILDAWMDFDANGWDPGDRIIDGYVLTPGVWNPVPFDVPLIGPPGDPGGLTASERIYSRFRLTALGAPGVATGLADTMGPAAISGVDVPTGFGGIGEVEDYLYDAPTAVTVASFMANQDGASILAEWQTASEIDNVGFNLYRAESDDGVRTRLNDALIPSRVPPGSPVGAAYEFLDETVELGVVYDYWLEAVNVQGQAETHGPVSAGVLTLAIDPGLWTTPSDATEGGD